MNEFNITALIPVLNRPQNVERLVKSFIDSVPIDRAEMLFITSASCKEEIDEINKISNKAISLAIVPDDIMSWAKRINWGINYSQDNTHFSEKSTWVLCGADDIIFHKGWFEVAEESSQNFNGILGTNDLGNHACIVGEHTTHPIVSRNYIQEYGTIDEPNKLLHEGYIHNFVDVEMVSTAKQRNCWKGMTTCIIEHMHPAWKKAEWDPVYQRGQDNLGHDRQLWITRSAKFKLIG